MNILVAVEELRAGGAQTFALRFAQALHDAGHRVWLYTMYWQYSEDSMLRRLAPDVKFVHYQPGNQQLDMLLQRTEGWLERKGLASPVRTARLRKHLTRFLREAQIDVVSSNTFRCDELMAQALEPLPHVPLVVTMHGDYEQFLAFYRAGKEHVLPNYLPRLTRTLRRVNGIAYLSEQNLEVLKPSVLPGANTQHLLTQRIYNGLSAAFSPQAGQRNRTALGIPPDAFVFGMVARGVAGKGWQPLTEAYRRLRAESTRPLRLLLVGEGPAIDALRAQYAAEADILFTGFTDNPVDYVANFDVGVLASSLRESLPNSIAEYLFCGKPTISTDIGEVRNMLCTEEGEQAGLLIDFPNQGLTDTEQLYQAMRRYLTEPALLAKHQALAPHAFAQFRMERCVAAYTALYQSCTHQLASGPAARDAANSSHQP
ncbi:glycosyltransferase family 4 protein [Hymenobacter koreensis]|uniref:Glycosyltransferase subfamily 4-like N-terminal domain-containing protein n=1 Tax=Hymenobacter koreensis TaxID=1084523 RepID=A0ABP8IUQ1_9BACT